MEGPAALEALKQALIRCPLIASVQADPGSPLDDPETLWRCAEASLLHGVQVLRLQGIGNIDFISSKTSALIIGLVKKDYPGSEVYITPTETEVDTLIATRCEVIALDGTVRERPGSARLGDLIERVHAAGRLALADCDSIESALEAIRLGADVISTTLSGYTGGFSQIGPDIDLVRSISFLRIKAIQAQSPSPTMDVLMNDALSMFKVLRVVGADGEQMGLLSGSKAVSRANEQGCDLILISRSTDPPIAKIIDLKRYRKEVPHQKGPLVVAEGRYEARWQVEAALAAGADAVVVGGALNDPVKNTRRLLPRFTKEERPVIAIDIGATWLRAGVASDMDYMDMVCRVPLPKTRVERLKAIGECIAKCQNNYDVDRVGISSAGVIWNNQVTLSKKFIPEHQGTDYNVLREGLIGDDPIGIIALGDGHASAWAHAMHPNYAGKDIVVLAIGTGLGFGHVREGKIVMGPAGEYSRLNDLPGPGGKSFEQILGGMFLTATPSDEQKALANEAVHQAIRMVSTLLFPDVVVLCGTVGMQPWLNLEVEVEPGWPQVRVERSPLHADAGLYGAAALALYPPFQR